MLGNNVHTAIGDSNNSDGVAIAVPANLKTLIRMIMRAFYGFELYLCMEMLLQYSCVKEEDLAELLRLDLKQVHQHLVYLKREKFVNEKLIMETSNDGKQSKHSCFYINYKMMVNVIKYKLDKIRIQIESEENQCTSRANFKCTNCKKTYTDLDTKDIFLTMTCLYCGSEVDEDVSCLPTRTTRNLLAKFNTQMEIVFDLLGRVEHVRLADDILRPEPIDMSSLFEQRSGSTSQNAANIGGVSGPAGSQKPQSNGKSAMVRYDALGNVKWSGDKTRNTDLLGQTRISINFDSNNNASGSGTRQAKELPSIILLNQTTDETDYDLNPLNRDSMLLKSVQLAADETLNNNRLAASANSGDANLKPQLNTNETTLTAANQASNNKALAAAIATSSAAGGTNLELVIMQKLLIHEKKTSSTSNEITNDYNNTGSVSSPGSATSSNASTTIASASSSNGSSILITKKRNLDTTNSDNKLFNDTTTATNGYMNNGALGVLNQLENLSNTTTKKRKLNNGDIVSEETRSDSILKTTINGTNGYYNHNNMNRHYSHQNSYNSYSHYQKTYSDGSDRELDEQDDEFSSDCYQSMDNLLDDDYEDHDPHNPCVTVQNKYVPLDRLTPKLINLMNANEKDYYINMCRQLYTEIYEL